VTGLPAGPPELLTPAEAGVLFRVRARTIARWSREGRFPEGTVVRVGRVRRYRRLAVEQLVTNWRPS
jgi:predicted site-specific integrase-resolvase